MSPSCCVASTIPSDTPNFIFLGLRLAMTTTNFPINCSGAYDFLIPAKIVLVSSPKSTSSSKSFLESSSSLALITLATRKSTLIKSSIVILSVLDNYLFIFFYFFMFLRLCIKRVSNIIIHISVF